MTDEERREAERLAEIAADKENHRMSPYNACARAAFEKGYAAACEAKSKEMKIGNDAWRKLSAKYNQICGKEIAERVRSAKLLEALKFYASPEAMSCVLKHKGEDVPTCLTGDSDYFQDPADLPLLQDGGNKARKAIAEHEASRD
jgi:hypothetical protein